MAFFNFVKVFYNCENSFEAMRTMVEMSVRYIIFIEKYV